MAKIYVFDMISLDGYFAGPNNELDWHNVDDEFNEFAISQLHDTGLLVFGRVTYEMMFKFWTSDFARKTDPAVTKLMNDSPKVVVSKTLKTADWKGTQLISSNIEQQLNKLKVTSEQDIGIFGSSILCCSLLSEDLIDELRIMVNPVLLGDGRTLFEGMPDRVTLNLDKSRTFKSGNILLTYSTIAKKP